MEKKVLKQKTVVGQVMEEIKELIATGKVKPNDRFPPENELAEMFGVSRPTIREAIKIFNYLGVLASHTGKGTYVSDRASISSEALTWSILLGDVELAELIEIREILEERSILKLTRKVREAPESTKDTMEKLDVQIQKMKIALDMNSKEDLTEADYEFHALIIAGSGNSLFSAIFNTLKAFMHEEIKRTHRSSQTNEHILTEHLIIFEAIKSADHEEALRAFRNHISSIHRQIFST